MTVGEKIKYYRNIRGISQEMLGNLSGINPATIKKYEYGIRNPKPDQLLKITNALGISINLFMDFDIETVSDVLSLLFKLDEQVDMKFEVEKDKNGEFIPSTVKLSFQNAAINQKLCTYLKAKEIKENLENSKEKFSAENDYTETVSDVLSLLFKLDEQVDMKFEVEKDKNGEFIPSTVKLSFQNAAINQKLCTYLKAKEIKENLENSKEKFSAENDYTETINEIEQNIEDIKNHLVDDNMVVKKGTDGITVKLYSDD